MDKTNSILQLFPDSLRSYFMKLAQQNEDLNEIHIRTNQPVLIKRQSKEFILLEDGDETVYIKLKSEQKPLIIDADMMDRLFSHICRYSPYAFQDELRQGFLTVANGHRIGVAGQVLREGDRVRELRQIRYLNIRIAHEILGAADPCMDAIYDERKQVRSCLIIAPPGKGKTTVLRDLIRQVSNGSEVHRGRTIGVVDERSELASAYLGVSQNNLGMRTDVLDNCPKAEGMLMLLRSMSPEVIAIDEIATREDVRNLLYLLNCGVKVFVTVHGTSLEDVRQKPYMKPLFAYGYFQVFFILTEHGIDVSLPYHKEELG